MRAWLWFFSAGLILGLIPPSGLTQESSGKASRVDEGGLSNELHQVVKLGSLIQEALENSPGLQAKKRAHEAARARAIAAWLPDDPQIGVDVEGQSALFRFNRTDNEYSIIQTIPFPTTLLLRGQLALRDAEMAFQRYKEEERSVVWHIEQPYYELSLAKKTLAALEDIRALVERLSKAVQTRYESNRAPQQDLLKAQIEASKVDIDIFQWKEKERLAEAHFSHILNRPLDTRYTVSEEPSSPPVPWSQSDLERLAVQVRPELQAFEIGIKRAKTSRVLAATAWLPDITARIEARQFRHEGSIREYDTFLGITVPVWSLIKGVGGEWKSASREVEAAEAAYTEMKNEVLLAIHEAYSKTQTAEHALRTYESFILPQAKQAVEVAFASYEAGRADFLTLIDAQRTLKDVQMAYYTFRAQHELGLSDLRRTVGENVTPHDQSKTTME